MSAIKTVLTAAFFVLAASASHAQMANGEDCGHPSDQPGKFGPYEYTDRARHQELNLVDSFHFTPYMQELAVNGFTSLKPKVKEDFGEPEQVVAANLDYALYAFPNHHRALYAMAVWQLRMRGQSETHLRQLMVGINFRPAECYFLRAIMWNANDGTVRQVYGTFFHKAGDLRRAEEQYAIALKLIPNSAELHYNVGLLYVSLKDYEKAREHAARAQELGYPLKGLQKQLERVRATK